MIVDEAYPIPKPFTGLDGRPSKYRFAEMEVGEHEFFPGQKNGGSAHSYACKLAARSKGRLRFSALQMEGGIRIWRVA